MKLASYGSNRKQGRAQALRRPLGALILGITLISTLATGCSSKEHHLSLAFGDGFSMDQSGFDALLSKLHSMNADDRIGRLRTFADSAAPASIKQQAAYVLARDLQTTGAPEQLAEAMRRYQQAQGQKALANRCAWHIVECAAKAGNEEAVRHELQKIVAANKESATGNQRADQNQEALRALYAIGQSYMRSGDDEKARDTFQQVRALAPESQFALGTAYYIAQLDLKKARGPVTKDGGTPTPPADAEALQAQAIAEMERYLHHSPDGRFALDIANQLLSMPGWQPDNARHNLLAEAFYNGGDYRSALNQWRLAGNKSAWFKQADCLLRTGNTAAAKALLTAGVKQHPSDEATPAAAARLCRMLNRDGAIAVWQTVLQGAPKFADVALYNLAIRAPSEAAAQSYYQRLLSAHPDSAYAPESAWWLSWHTIKAGNSAAALPMLKAAAARYPESRAASRFDYWTGKMYERLGQKEAAKAAYHATIRHTPWHYYAHRAKARLAVLEGGRDRGWRTNPQRRVHWTEDTADEWQFPEPPRQLCLQRGETLSELTALKQWDECLELCPQEDGLLRGFYLAKLNMPLEAINAAGKALHGQPCASEEWQLSYPLLYAKFIASEAPAKNVDPLLVQALIREESRYNAMAISGSHALGLMQLMPGTAAGVAKRLGIRLSSNADIHEPQNNMRMGIDYLSYVLRRFDGNALFAVASYNGGPNAVKSWAAHMPGDTDIFVENIPFKETRDYVRKVFGSYWNYEAVYATPPSTAHSR